MAQHFFFFFFFFIFLGREGQKVLYSECTGIPGTKSLVSSRLPGFYLGAAQHYSLLNRTIECKQRNKAAITLDQYHEIVTEFAIDGRMLYSIVVETHCSWLAVIELQYAQSHSTQSLGFTLQ